MASAAKNPTTAASSPATSPGLFNPSPRVSLSKEDETRFVLHPLHTLHTQKTVQKPEIKTKEDE
jgi:hypothetical protein